MKFADRLRAFAESISDYAHPEIINEAASLIEDLESDVTLVIRAASDGPIPMGAINELTKTYARLEKLNRE
jgi:hypothetical protein